MASVDMSAATTEFLIKYLSTTDTVDWQWTGAMVAADLVNEQSKAKRPRKPTREILKQRRRLSEYFTLVREMRLGDSRDYFEYFRMSVESMGKDLDNHQLGIPPPRNVPGASVKLPYVLVGDEAFPLEVNLMRPYPGSQLDDVWTTVLLQNYLRTLDDEEDGFLKYCSDKDVDRVGQDGEILPGSWRSGDTGTRGLLTSARSLGSNNYNVNAKSVRDA
ncbi:hypothetical protein MTO96_028297 [Rhipicephalus appendiculatus]